MTGGSLKGEGTGPNSEGRDFPVNFLRNKGLVKKGVVGDTARGGAALREGKPEVQ